jgi:hypothetical protein
MTITQFMSKPDNFAYVNAATDSADKQKRIAELKNQFDRSNFSGGQADFAEEKAFGALSQIRQHLAKISVAETLKGYLTARNSVIRANRKKKRDFQEHQIKAINGYRM